MSCDKGPQLGGLQWQEFSHTAWRAESDIGVSAGLAPLVALRTELVGSLPALAAGIPDGPWLLACLSISASVTHGFRPCLPVSFSFLSLLFY
jgi:hypothetical protein